jgi:hypothetical protein
MKRTSINGLEYEAFEAVESLAWKKQFDAITKVDSFSAKMGADKYDEDVYECVRYLPYDSEEEKESFETFGVKKVERKYAVYFREGILLVFDRSPYLMDILDAFITAWKAKNTQSAVANPDTVKTIVNKNGEEYKLRLHEGETQIYAQNAAGIMEWMDATTYVLENCGFEPDAAVDLF